MNKKLKKVSGYRHMLGLTQQEISMYLGITSQSYSSKERGVRPFSDSEKIKLKALFRGVNPNITIDTIFFN